MLIFLRSASKASHHTHRIGACQQFFIAYRLERSDVCSSDAEKALTTTDPMSNFVARFSRRIHAIRFPESR